MRITVLILLFCCFLSSTAWGADDIVALPWTTTYDCDEWLHQAPWTVDPTCTDDEGALRPRAANYTCEGENEKITLGANNPDGGGGLGHRHYLGDTCEANNTGGMEVELATGQAELWIRWYMRAEEGFEWEPDMLYYKILYIDPTADYSIPEFENLNWLRNYINEVSTRDTTFGWNDIMVAGTTDGNGNQRGDGLWHYYEVHIKKGIGDGVSQMWVDGVLRINSTGINTGSGTWDTIRIGSNQDTANNDPIGYFDYDDIVISSTGYIGPIEVAAPTPNITGVILNGVRLQ